MVETDTMSNIQQLVQANGISRLTNIQSTEDSTETDRTGPGQSGCVHRNMAEAEYEQWNVDQRSRF